MKLTAETKVISTKDAQKLRAAWNHALNRPLCPANVIRMETGLASKSRIPVLFIVAKLTKKTGVLSPGLYLMDGRHKLEALCNLSLTKEAVVITVEYEDEELMRTDFANLDSRKPRTLSDAINYLGMVEKMGFSNSHYIKVGAASLYLMACGFNMVGTTRKGIIEAELDKPGTRVALTEDWRDELLDLAKLYERRPKNIQKRASSAAIAGVFLTLLKHYPDKDRVRDFITACLSPGCKGSGDPAHAVYKILTACNKDYDLRYQGQAARHVAYCWNSHLHGKQAFYSYEPNPASPIIIEGTPWNGKKVDPISITFLK